MKLLTAVAVMLAAGTAFAQDETVGVRGRLWFAELDGSAQVDGSALAGTDLDFTDDLGLDDSENIKDVQLFLDVPIVGRVIGGYWWASFEGDQVINRDIAFNNVIYTASTTVSSKVDLDVAYVTWEPVLASPSLGDMASLEVGLQAGIRYFRFEGALDSAGVSESDKGSAPLPVVGAHVAMSLADWVRADVEAAGFALNLSDRSVKYLEASAEVSLRLISGLFAGVGYRIVDVGFDDESGSNDTEIDVGLSGPYLTAGIRF